MNPFAARSACVADLITRAATAQPVTTAAVSAAAPHRAAPPTAPMTAPSGGAAAGRASLAVPPTSLSL